MSDKKSRQLEIQSSEFGKGTVLLDGKDISNDVSEIKIHAKAGEANEVELRIPASKVSINVSVDEKYFRRVEPTLLQRLTRAIHSGWFHGVKS